MQLSDFDYCLPKELIAQYPLKDRSSSRLMVVERKTKKISHRCFKDFKDYLANGDCLVLNNTRVFPARLFGKRASGGKVEILLLRKNTANSFKCLFKPSRIKTDEKIIFDSGSFSARLLRKQDQGSEIVFEVGSDVDKLIERFGVMPLPPYIKRQAQESDRETYQTVYAKLQGSVAAPTAGLHFTGELLKEIKGQDVDIAFLTLHVGIGTFKPVKAQDITAHKMEKEEFILSNEAADLINKTKEKGKRIFSVGTTTTRVLEALALGAKLSAKQGETDLFIYPGYNFKIVDCLLTNFHLPKSTLFLLTCAFGGQDLIFKAYEEAKNEKYRFYSYGDAMLIL